MKNIGIWTHNVILDSPIYYYNYYSKECGSNSEPILTKITSGPFMIGQQWTCKVLDVSGVVALSHLSKEYYPKEYVRVKQSEIRYKEYIKVADCYNSFAQAFGIIMPSWECKDGLYRVYSNKYEGVSGEFRKTQKDAKASYKEALYEHKRKLRKDGRKKY